MKNLLHWPVVNGELTCPECGAPALAERVPGSRGPLSAYAVKCTKCWKAQCTDPHSTRWKGGY
jgi:hypothetical protein